MSMSKKDFIALADTVRGTRPTSDTESETGIYHPVNGRPSGMYQWEKTRDALADFCAAQNPRFNRARWLAYIAGEVGPNGGAVKGGAK